MLNSKIPSLLLASLLCSLGIAAFSSPSFAQNQPQNAVDSSRNPNEPGSTISGSNNGLNMFDIIMRSQLANGRDSQEVLQQQRQSLDDSEARFLRQRLELINNSSPTPDSGTTPTQNP
jgi:hypothetical protein